MFTIIDNFDVDKVPRRQSRRLIHFRIINIINKNQAIDQKTVQIATLSKIRGQKRKFSQPLSLISSLLPETVRCKEINFKDADGEIKGTALDYDDLVWLVKSMQSLNVFKQVSLSVTDRATNKEQERIEFTIVVRLA